MYANGGGLYPCKLNSWETMVVEAELAKPNVVAWFRNLERKPWSLVVPYHHNGQWKPLYPDFLMIRREGNSIVVDLLDPHALSLEDAPAKAAGLAQFAAEYGHEFGRIELIIVDGDKLKRLNLNDEFVRDKVKGVSTHEHLRQLYDAL